jgi:tRNA A-37 threonylcarbamoyl transferase component Bud32
MTPLESHHRTDAGDVGTAKRVEAEWRQILGELGIEGAYLVAENQLDPGRRTYVHNGRLYKVVHRGREATAHLRKQSLRGEYQILRRLDGVRGVPQNPALVSEEAFGCVHYEHINASVLSMHTLQSNAGPILAQVAQILTDISCRGVVHNDVTLRNLLIDMTGHVTLTDFDQSRQVRPAKAFFLNFAATAHPMKPPFGTFKSLAKEMASDFVLRPIKSVYRRTHQSLKNHRAHARLPQLDSTASHRLKSLYNAWVLALESDANSPGRPVAYYELCEHGHTFPGERPWKDRWETFRSVTDFRGKRVLELGCNLSLLSCFLLRERRASAALCIDADATILAAAHLVADAYSVSPAYRQVDFDGPEDWESELLGFEADVVFALSVLNWIEDKPRFLDFLAKFDEVIFEGHDPFEVERERFTLRGFTEVELVGVSVRDRPVLRCTRGDVAN